MNRDTALVLPHDHPNRRRLTAGCPGCIRRVEVDQALAEMEEMDLDDLIGESSIDGPPVTWRNRCADRVLRQIHGIGAS